MTPMVDLAFLLLTFFVLTTTFHKNHVMEVAMPDRQGPSSPVNADNVLNLVLSDNNKIYWWTGLNSPIISTDYSPDGVRQLLLKKNSENPGLVVLIKPNDDAKFQNIVDILDEMEITKTKRFAIVQFTKDEQMFLDAQVADR